METDVHRKPTHTDKYLSFNSHHPRSHKKSVATTLLQRAESLTSNSVARDNERQYVKALSFQHQITPDEETSTGVSKRWVVDAILCGDCIL